MKNEIDSDWWDEKYDFFGEFYMEGDNSKEGYLEDKNRTIVERTEEDVDGVVRLLGMTGGERILDIPCGYGRHSIELAKRGYAIVGIDINATHLKNAIDRLRELGIAVDFRKESMLDIAYFNQFDHIINMCYSFGFFETDSDNREVLRNFFRALKPGGKFLMETDVNLSRVRAGKYKENEIRKLISGNQLQIIDRYSAITKRMDGAWIIIRPDGTLVRKDYSVRVFEKDEFVDWCLDAGFVSCEAYGNWWGSPYDENSEQIIFVAHKK
ncbi:MAG: methyltransferase domain-containing protein [Parcubacteria group bacterium]|jgi:cyclopropane fatty-acyl-phospholipid synthase-like methyltransferase